MARVFNGAAHTLRFIEYMDVGHTNGWRLDDVVPAAEIVAAIDAELGIEPLEPGYRGEVARRYRYRDGGGEVGVIASVTQPFCGTAHARGSQPKEGLHLSVRGLGSQPASADRNGASDDRARRRRARDLGSALDRYSELRSSATEPAREIEMSYIGG